MRNLFRIVLATAALLAIPGYSVTDAPDGPLTFFVVSQEKIQGGRFIDTMDFPKLGYVGAKPDLLITQLVAVTATVSHSSDGKIAKDGSITETPLPDRPALDVQISQKDSQKLESLTKQNIGKQVVLMVGNVPLIAPIVLSPISKQTFELTIGERADHVVIENALRKLVR